MINYTLKLKALLITLLLSYSSMHGMIEPYKPSFSARHPVLTRLAQAGGIGIGMYLAACYAEQIAPEFFGNISKTQAGAAGFIAFLGTYLYQARKKPNLVDSVLCDPLTALHYSYRIHDEFRAVKHNNLNNINNIVQFRAEYNALVKQFELKCPFFLLGECTKEDCGPCLLSRTFLPKYREKFEHHVTQALLEKLSTGRPVYYTSFGCGGAFQDLVIIAKTLAQKPNACIHIDLIDFEHTPFATSCDILNLQRQISENSTIDLTSGMDKIKKYARVHWGAEQYDDALIEKRISEECMVLEATYKQFINWLKKTFPHAQLTLTIYDKVQSTLEYLERNGGQYPDVISAVDIQDEMSWLKDSVQEYGKLCKAILQKKPNAHNIWLTKEYGGASLTTISLVRNHPTDKEVQLKNEDGSETTIYYQITLL